MEVTTQEFRDIQTLVRSLCGLVLSDDKSYLVETRLASVVKAHGFLTFAEYLGRLQQYHAVPMRDELVEALTTGETSFNRDTHPFAEFRRRILPILATSLRQRQSQGELLPRSRIWSAGCSTGQEPYSIAMSVQDFLDGHDGRGLQSDLFPILATDVSSRSLATAKAGWYATRDLDRGVTLELRNRFFKSKGEGWVVIDELRRQIDFRRFNFLDAANHLGQFEVIFCRNVLIYFDEPTRQRLCDQFHRLLQPGGFLVLGAAESLYGLKTPFQSEQLGSTYVYRKDLPVKPV